LNFYSNFRSLLTVFKQTKIKIFDNSTVENSFFVLHTHSKYFTNSKQWTSQF
jgi:hypothetical protein